MIPSHFIDSNVKKMQFILQFFALYIIFNVLTPTEKKLHASVKKNLQKTIHFSNMSLLEKGAVKSDNLSNKVVRTNEN